ncbi:MAG: DUF1749 domain-containing protein [Bacilli bacterium]|nr:DUF1749 domain-containing protein [Bacilli bacterium]
MEQIYDYTSDGLRLSAFHWETISKGTCIVFIHGQGGNVLENYFAHIWGRIFNENNIGFIYGHNRGYGHINDIITKEDDLKRCGATFEIFEESLYDVDLWLNKAYELGYEKVILMGHSLGCNKVIYYIYKKNPHINGLILASPPDMVGLTLLEEPTYEDLVKEAQANVNNGNPKKLLNELLDGYSYTSSENFLNFYLEGNNIDNIPIERNPQNFEQFNSIKVKTLAFSGSNETGPYSKIELLKEKAINCPDFEVSFIKDSGHTYNHHEEDVANLIVDWLSKNN